MRDKLLEEILCILTGESIDTEKVRSRLYILLRKYEIEERCTELSTVHEDDISKYIRLFLINKKVAGRTERTLAFYKGQLNNFFEGVNKSPIEVTSDDIKLYLATKEIRDGNSKVTIANTSRAIASFYKWMTKEEYITRDPMYKVDSVKVPKRKKHAFTEFEIEKLRHIVTDKRDIAILEVLLSTWCRVSEVEQMNISDIKGEKMEVLGKGEKTRTVYLNAKAQVALADYLQSRTDKNDALFVSRRGKATRLSKGSLEKITKDYGEKCGIDKCHPHRFRRTGATFALRRGMPIEQVSRLLGHENIETTQIYLDISEDALEQAHRKYV